MNGSFQVIGLLCHVWFNLFLWLTQIFVDCNRFAKGEINEVRTE